MEMRLSRLESLPVELVEIIFFYDLNINLPRASPLLAAKLSSERIYRTLIILAFGYCDHKIKPSVASLQSAIVGCRWLTSERIRACSPELLQLVLRRYWFGNGITGTRLVPNTPVTPIETQAQQKEQTQTQAQQEEMMIRAIMEPSKGRGPIFLGTNKDQAFYLIAFKGDPYLPVVGIKIISRPFTQGIRTRLVCRPRILNIETFPEKWLRGGGGGFTDETINLLEIFRMSCTFDPNRNPPVTFSRKAIQRGIHVALAQKDAPALASLLKIDERFTRSYLEDRRRHLDDHDYTLSLFSPGLYPIEGIFTINQSYYSISPAHFRTAVRMGGCDPTLFQLLLRANAESVPIGDPEVTEWATNLSNPFGRWLLDFMHAQQRSPFRTQLARTDPFMNALFYYGSLNRSLNMGQRYFDEVMHGNDTIKCWGKIG
jgi:hypothetical protein